MSLQEKRDQRKALAVALNKLVKDQPSDHVWTDENQKEYDGLVNQIENIDKDLERQQKVLDLQASKNAKIQQTAVQLGISTDQAEHNQNQHKAAFAKYLRGGVEALDEEQRTLLAQRLQSPQNTMSTGTGSEGGYLTQEELAPELSVALKEYGGMRELATVVPTMTGSRIPWPTTDATTEEGEWLAENAEADDEDTTFGVRNIDTFMVSSKVIAVPFQLLQDNHFDLESYITGLIAQRIGRTTEKAFVNGTGSEQPHGLLADITAGKVGTTGQTVSVIYDDLLDLQHSVDPAYRKSGKCGYMMHDTTIKVVKKIKDTTGRPLWLPGIEHDDPSTFNGYRYVINQNMPVMAANAKSIAFGDFSKYVIRDVMQMMFFRFTDSFYSKKGQVGFLAFMRSGGRYVDVGGAIKYYQNSAT